MQYYVALIADIKGSRKYRAEERGYLQDLTNESLLFANELFKEGIEKEVVFSAGDEVQGLFREPATAFLYYRFLCFLLGPGVLRGGLGVGTWDVRLEEGASTSQDGEATIMHAPLSSRLRRGSASILFSARRNFQTRC